MPPMFHLHSVATFPSSPPILSEVVRQGANDDPLGGLRVLFYLATVLPWTIVQFYDAVGVHHKTITQIVLRLLLSSVLNCIASGVALFYMLYSLLSNEGRDYTEGGTMLVALIVNCWFWMRNVKGYCQRKRLRDCRGAYLRFLNMATSTTNSYRYPNDFDLRDPCWTCITPIEVYGIVHPWTKIEINNLVIDNDINHAVPSIPLRGKWKSHPATSRAFWMAVWSQARRGELLPRIPLTTECEQHLAMDFGTDDPHCCEEYYNDYNAHAEEEGHDRLKFENARERRAGLEKYPDGFDDEHSGQQDVTAVAYRFLYTLSADDHGFCKLLAYVAKTIPHSLTNAWYISDTWEYIANTTPPNLDLEDKWIPPPPGAADWNEIALTVAKQNVNASGLGALEAIRYTGRILAASNILAYHHQTYVGIVDSVLKCGKTARWTYGWSGRLACYSALWTRDQVYLALLDGITLLGIRLNKYEIPAVVDLLTAYASFTIMEERSCYQILMKRQEELTYRYCKNKGKTCRGSGVAAIRETCSLLNIPAACSKLDGHPAFLMGWCVEYRLGQPGNQRPEYGEDHDAIEKLHGSSNAIRYPNAII